MTDAQVGRFLSFFQAELDREGSAISGADWEKRLKNLQGMQNSAQRAFNQMRTDFNRQLTDAYERELGDGEYHFQKLKDEIDTVFAQRPMNAFQGYWPYYSDTLYLAGPKNHPLCSLKIDISTFGGASFADKERTQNFKVRASIYLGGQKPFSRSSESRIKDVTRHVDNKEIPEDVWERAKKAAQRAIKQIEKDM